MPFIGRSFHGVARAILILALFGWVVSWPILIAAAGATLERPDHGSHVAFLVTAEAMGSAAGLLALLSHHEKAWLWIAIGVIGLWIPIAGWLAILFG